jgi:electron transfer flavoprotein beta subunit
MTILVPIKRVPDPYSKVRPLPDGSGIDTGAVKFEINPFDEIALEEAVRIKEADPSVTVLVVSIGPADAQEQLRKGLAMGADKAILIETDQVYDALGVANELKAVIQQENPDLVLMGKQSTDFDQNQVAQMLAAKLGWPQATFASKVTVSGGSITVTRETDNGEETLSMSLPALVTSDLRLNEPRYIALPGIIKARSKPLETRTPSTSPSPKIVTKKVEAAPARAAGKKVGSVAELVSELRAKGVL